MKRTAYAPGVARGCRRRRPAVRRLRPASARTRLRPIPRNDARLLPVPRALQRHPGLHRRGGSVARRHQGRRRAAADDASVPKNRGRRSLRMESRWPSRPRTRDRPRSTRSRSTAACRCGRPSTARRARSWAGRRPARSSTRRAATRRSRTRSSRAWTPRRACRPWCRSRRRATARTTRAGRTLYFTRLAFQGSYTKRYQRRHRAEPLAVRQRRRRSHAAHGRLRGHQQDARCCGRAASIS